MNRKLRIVLLTLFFSLSLDTPPPARAELTAQEKIEVREVETAIEHLLAVWVNFGRTLYVTTPANQPALNNLWASLMPVQSDLTRALALLLQVNPAPPGDTALFNTYESMARTAWVSEAFSKLGLVTSGVATAKTSAQAAELVTSQDSDYYLALTDVKFFLDAITTDVANFNTSLPYTSPRATIWAPQVVSPHGNYVASTRLLFEAIQQMTAAMSTLRLVYNPASQGESALPTGTVPNTPFLKMTFSGAELMEKFTSALHTWANIPRINHCQFSPHHFMARIVERLTQISSESTSATTPYRGGEFSGAPYRFHMATTFLSDFLEPLRVSMHSRPLTWQQLNKTIAHWFKSWQASDGSVWRLMEFPQGVTIESLRTQAGRTNSVNVPPICPDTVAPEVTWLYPANGQTIRGRQTLSMDCRDSIGTPSGLTAGTDGESSTMCSKVEFKINGGVVASIPHAPYEYRWDTTLSTNAAYSLQAVGYDAAGNSTATTAVTVTVAN
jgi:hypothetical protein